MSIIAIFIKNFNPAEWLRDLLMKWGVDKGIASQMEQFITTIIILIIAFIANYILKNILIACIKHVLNKYSVENTIRDLITRILKRIANIIIILIIISFAPAALATHLQMLTVLNKTGSVIIIFLIALSLTSLLRIGYLLVSKKKKFQDHPIKSFFQIVQIIFFLIATIISISLIIDKSPKGLLTGIGAFAAVISFIFKDTILGFISGIQLSANDMVRIGDWIVVGNSLANGVIIEINLITVKIQNFDNTFVYIPTYQLVSNQFQNYRGMTESGGRRIYVPFNIDMHSVKICSNEELENLKKYVQLPDKYSEFTNLELFRIYITRYLQKHPHTNKEMIIMVMYASPSSQGIPFQIYCFTDNTNWTIYEAIKAEILEHVIAKSLEFKLVLYQNISNLELS